MNTTSLTGDLIRLTVPDPEKDSELFNRWDRDSFYQRLANGNAVRLFSRKNSQQWIEKDLKSTDSFSFMIRTRNDDRPIGGIELDGIDWIVGNAWVGIGIGERDSWGKGYGTDAMRVILRFAFDQLNLRRVSLSVFEFNARAIRSYEKAGFHQEGRARKWMNRAGQRWDVIYMGILRSEWEATQAINRLENLCQPLSIKSEPRTLSSSET